MVFQEENARENVERKTCVEILDIYWELLKAFKFLKLLKSFQRKILIFNEILFLRSKFAIEFVDSECELKSLKILSIFNSNLNSIDIDPLILSVISIVSDFHWISSQISICSAKHCNYGIKDWPSDAFRMKFIKE